RLTTSSTSGLCERKIGPAQPAASRPAANAERRDRGAFQNSVARFIATKSLSLQRPGRLLLGRLLPTPRRRSGAEGNGRRKIKHRRRPVKGGLAPRSFVSFPAPRRQPAKAFTHPTGALVRSLYSPSRI